MEPPALPVAPPAFSPPLLRRLRWRPAGEAPPPSDEHVATTFPVLFVNGANDATIDHAAAARSLAALDRPDASAVAVAGAGHGLADDEGRLLDWGLRRLGLGCISVS